MPRIPSFLSKINCLSSSSEENQAIRSGDVRLSINSAQREIPGLTRPQTTQRLISTSLQSLKPKRSLDQKLADWRKDCPLTETRAREQTSTAIKKALRTKAKSLSLNWLYLTSLPDCLTELNHLERLSVTRNHLKHLPPLPVSLKVLSAEHNHLNKLSSLPPALTELNVTDNELESLPALPDALRKLFVSQNLLNVLPALTASISNIRLNNNNLVELPTEFEEILQNNNGQLTARANPWSDESLFRLEEMSRSIDILDLAFAEPDVDNHRFSLNDTNWEPISTGVEHVLTLMAESKVTDLSGTTKPEGEPTAWEDIAIEEHAGAFAQFLRDLSRTKEYKDSRSDTIQRIDHVLETLQNSATLRAICFPIALEACGNCHDRVSLTLNDMEMAILTHRIETGEMDTDQLFDQLRGVFRLETINTIAIEHTLRRRIGLTKAELAQADEAQLRLGYHTRLAERLNLPVVTRNIHYPKCTNVTEKDLEIAQEKIVRCENSDQFIQFLARWKPWQKAMERRHPEVFEKMREDIEFNRTPRSSFPIAMTEKEYIDDLKNLAIYEQETLKIKMAPLTRDFILRR